MTMKRYTRWKVLVMTAMVLGRSVTAAAPASAQRPTLVARSNSCETITLDYDHDSGPPSITVAADGPELIETTVERGETVTINDINPGTYDIEA